MTDYTELENLSDEDILNTYDDVILISDVQAHCLCTCVDGYRVNYTCYSGRSSTCIRQHNVRTGTDNRYLCQTRFCTDHGGMQTLIDRPDSGDPCCYEGSSCWRYSITTW